jgi:hypothetical protein
MQTIVKLSELKSSKLLSQRTDFGAVLPAALAQKEGLKSLPGTIELKRLVEPGSKRLSCISIRT